MVLIIAVYCEGLENVKLISFVSPSPTVTLMVWVPSFSCQAEISYSPAGKLFKVYAPSALVTAKNGCDTTETHALIQGCTSHFIGNINSSLSKTLVISVRNFGIAMLNSGLIFG